MRRSIARSPPIEPHPAAPAMDASKPLRPSASYIKRTRYNLWIVAAVIIVAAALFFYLLNVSADSLSDKRGFGVVIDGGSTGTRIHVFQFSMERGIPVLDLGRVESASSMKVNPGLSDYVVDPDAAGRSIVELLEFGKRRVPEEQWEKTEVRLMATAGLRRLGAVAQEKILESCRHVLRSSGFRFLDDWASVIPGPDEGIYAWVAANYALGTLGGEPQKTTGIIELGGASIQVTFASRETPPTEYSHMVKIGHATYSLYSHSFLHFGQNVAYESLRKLLITRDMKSSKDHLEAITIVDPCTPRGYSPLSESKMIPISGLKSTSLPTLQAQGNFSECRSAALMLFQNGKDECMYQHCSIGSTFIPTLQGKFLATENFFYTSKFFGLGSTASLSDLIMAGQQFCGEDWFVLKKNYPLLDQEDLLRYCFSSAYIVALLHDSLGFALDDDRLAFANQVDGMPIDWALGAFILLKANGSAEKTGLLGLFATILSDDPSTLFSVLAISSVLIFSVCSICKWRKPKLKTIYDLEKGHYIVKRVNR